jgi:hypothetical protein
MSRILRFRVRLLTLLPALIPAAWATSVPRLTLEQLTAASESVVSGRITQTWAAWDSEHKFIWTHYRLSVSETAKGPQTPSIEFAEPGGALPDAVQTIAGTVPYANGERVVVFLSRMPNGYLRTTGWAQGKYTEDESGRIHAYGASGAEFIEAGKGQAGTSLRSLEGIDFSGLKRLIAAHQGGAR